MAWNSSPACDFLTDDLISEILVRVPVKPLLRLKLVSKPWRSLITSPRFIKSQFDHAITKAGADQTLIVYKREDLSMTPLNLHSLQVGPRLGVPYSRGDFSFTPYSKLVASHDGVVCVRVSNFPRQQFNSSNFCKLHNPDIYIWNPATRQSKLLPPHTIRHKIKSVSVGFGFDPVGKEFKVVRIVASFDKPFCAEVYSVNRNAWRKVEPRPYDLPYYDEFDVCVKGLLCCTGMYGLMAFDLSREVFTSGIKIPVRCRSLRVYNARLTVVKDSIAVAFFSKRAELSGKVKLWTLDDDACLRGGEVEASWTLLLSVQVDLPVRFVRGYFNSGDILLVVAGEDTETWCLYNTDKKEAKAVPSSIYASQVIKYNESLVSVEGSKQVT
ncbi:F-box domain-containing protein [Heracleum sosnowskyi]|uniref:F-box domain-containing protein n=1 Tax=Heracleum sosnowskyi TaxID=360622 RepID=A0AAD8HFK9_9APIA|nr:F-box domain-containing protein [Heracleum sosnowskyi]